MALVWAFIDAKELDQKNWRFVFKDVIIIWYDTICHRNNGLGLWRGNQPGTGREETSPCQGSTGKISTCLIPDLFCQQSFTVCAWRAAWSGEHVDVSVQYDSHGIQGMTGTVFWSQSHLAEFQLTGAPDCLGVTYRSFVLFWGLMITKGGLKNHSSSVIFQIRTKVKALLWIFITILFAIFIRVCPQRWEFHWV